LLSHLFGDARKFFRAVKVTLETQLGKECSQSAFICQMNFGNPFLEDIRDLGNSKAEDIMALLRMVRRINRDNRCAGSGDSGGLTGMPLV
jgi:hypothetical protein